MCVCVIHSLCDQNISQLPIVHTPANVTGKYFGEKVKQWVIISMCMCRYQCVCVCVCCVILPHNQFPIWNSTWTAKHKDAFYFYFFFFSVDICLLSCIWLSFSFYRSGNFQSRLLGVLYFRGFHFFRLQLFHFLFLSFVTSTALVSPVRIVNHKFLYDSLLYFFFDSLQYFRTACKRNKEKESNERSKYIIVNLIL